MRAAVLALLLLAPAAQGLLNVDVPEAGLFELTPEPEPVAPVPKASPTAALTEPGPAFSEARGEPQPARLEPWLPTAPPTPKSWAPGDKELEFWCPYDPTGTPTYIGTLSVVYTCPQRIYDVAPGGNTGYLLGNVVVDVNEAAPDEMLMATLHGDNTRGGPAEYSRVQLTHSAYMSPDRGIRWGDEWTDTGNNGGIFGLENAAALDASGNMYVGYSWATPMGPGKFDYALYVYKGDHVTQTSERFMQIYGNDGYRLIGREEGNKISTPDLTYIWQPPVPVQVNGTVPPGEYGDYAVARDQEGHIVLSFHETAYDYATTSTGKSAWIDIHWTNTNRSNSLSDWNHVAVDQLIGPCRDSSNAVAWDGRIYIACTVDAGYQDRDLAKVGDVDLWSFDPKTGNTTFESYTRISGDDPKLAVTSDGYFAVMTSRQTGEQSVIVRASMGWHGKNWAQQHNVGTRLHQAMGGLPMLGAQITAIDISDDERTVFAIYKEWNNVTEDPEDIQPQVPGELRLKGYKKFIFTMDECTPLIAGSEFRIGDALVAANQDAYQEQAAQESPGVFNDTRDGLDIVRLENGEEFAWFGVGDYGAIQFGAVRVASGASDQPCAVTPAPPIIPLAPAVPAAIALGQGASLTAAASFGIPAVAMTAYLLTVKRRAPSFLAARDE